MTRGSEKGKNFTNWKIKRVQCGCKSELAKWQEAREARRLGVPWELSGHERLLDYIPSHRGKPLKIYEKANKLIQLYLK